MHKALRAVILPLMLFYGAMQFVSAQQPNVAPTPPMGWNSWDAYGLTITESQFRANVDVLKTKLEPFGWRYAVIDEGWFFFNPEARPTPDKLHYAIDRYGRYVPVPARFPSVGAEPASATASAGSLSASIEDTGFAALAAWVHSQGLRFGIHIVRGIPRASVERNLPIEGSSFHAQDAADQTDACPWDPTNWGIKDNAAGQAWYDSLLRQYASWGVDLLKVDCIANNPYKITEIQQIRRAIDKTGRPIVLSLSPGPTNLSHAQEVGSLANMWRISNDEWDIWSVPPTQDFPQGVKNQFARLAAWEPYAKSGNWPDADMLPFGELKPVPGWGDPRTSRLTLDEERTMLTLWAIARSPLIIGANLTMLDDPTLKLLTNRDLIRINQTAKRSQQVLSQGQIVAWRADLPGSEFAIAIFNLGDSATTATVNPADLGVQARGTTFRNVWTGEQLPNGANLGQRIPAHGAVVWLCKPAPNRAH